MIKIIRKNQKVVGVILGIILMVMFLGNLAPQGSQQSSQLLRKVATIDGEKVTQLELNNATAEWQLLMQTFYVDPRFPEIPAMPLTKGYPEDPRLPPFAGYPGRLITDQIQKAQSGNNGIPLYFLLWKEAERRGIVVTNEELNSVLTNNVTPNSSPELPEAVLHAMMIRRMADLDDGAIKITHPYRDYELALSAQNLTLKVAPIVVAQFMSTIPEPTDAQIQKQYDAYSDRVAVVENHRQFGSADDPLGFGYKTPNRLTLQYIGLSYADVAQTVRASKSTEDWYIAAFGEFKANRDDYDSKPLPSTQPSSTAQQPAPQKLDDVGQDFALHAPLVLDKLYTDATDALMQTAVNDLSQKLSAGFGTYRDATAGGAANPTSGPAADYLTYGFLASVGDSIHAKYGLTPILGNIPQLSTETDLYQIPGIGTSAVIGTQPRIYFPTYAAELYQPWISAADKNSPSGSLAIAQWQPSSKLADNANNIYFFRITGSEASHLPPLSAVKDEVIADWKLAAAYAKAQDAAKSLLAVAQHVGLDKAADDAHAVLLTTDPFNPYAIVSDQVFPQISPLRLKADSVVALANSAQQLLTTPQSPSGHRQLLANLYANSTVAVIQLETATPNWKDDPDRKSIESAEFLYGLRLEARTPLESGLFAADLVKSRMNYVSLEAKNQ